MSVANTSEQDSTGVTMKERNFPVSNIIQGMILILLSFSLRNIKDFNFSTLLMMSIQCTTVNSILFGLLKKRFELFEKRRYLM